MDKKTWTNIIKLVAKLFFSALLIYLVFQKIDIGQMRAVFLKSKLLFLFFALLLYMLSQVISAWRLIGFLKSTGINISAGLNFRLYMLGMFCNNFLPGGIGGDAYKIYLLRKKYRQPAKKIFLSLFLDRLSGLWAIFVYALLFYILLSGAGPEKLLIVSVFSAGTGIYFFIIKRFFSVYTANWFFAHAKALFVQLLQLLSVIFILYAQNLNIDLLPYLFMFLASSVATIIPVSIGGLGIREFVMLKSPAFLQIDIKLAVYMTLTFYLISLVAALPGAWFIYRVKEFKITGKQAD